MKSHSAESSKQHVFCRHITFLRLEETFFFSELEQE